MSTQWSLNRSCQQTTLVWPLWAPGLVQNTLALYLYATESYSLVAFLKRPAAPFQPGVCRHRRSCHGEMANLRCPAEASTLHLRFDQYSQVMTCRFAVAGVWMAALRDTCRWLVPTADTVYQHAALSNSSVFSYIQSSVWPEPVKPILVAFLIVLLLLWHCVAYELLPCTHSHAPAAGIICLIHESKPQKSLRA